MIPWLNNNAAFPRVEAALHSPNGLLAAGGELTAQRLLDAYRLGIFPWFNPGEPILWWSPDPRMVLVPGELNISRSLAKVLRNTGHEVRIDTAFEQVMRACAAPRGERPDRQPGTWIGEDVIAAYCALHEMGHAHSVEVWMPKIESRPQIEGGAGSASGIAVDAHPIRRSSADDLELAGGLYGVSIGRMFYGESMFSHASDASKIALAHLSRQLERWQFGLIDCQMSTPHLASLGAREIPRSEFIAQLQELVHCAPVSLWRFDTDPFT